MEDYKPNSFKYKEEQKQQAAEKKQLPKVISGTAKRKKKSEAQKLADIFISEDASKVKEYIFMDVLIPAAKKAISDIVTNSIDMILYGEAGRSKKSNTPATKVSYGSYYNNGRNDRDGYRQSTSRSTYSYDEVILATRGEAEAVITQMDEIVAQYGFVRVADLYDLVGITGSYTDNNYGWTDIRSAQVVRVRDGYLLKLPRALPID